VYDYDHDALAYDEALAGHYVLAPRLAGPGCRGCGRGARRVPVVAAGRTPVPGAQIHPRATPHPPLHRTPRPGPHRHLCPRRGGRALIGNRLTDNDLRDPDLDEQHLTTDRALQELDRIRQVTFTAGEQTITAITRRTQLQQDILGALGVDTRARTRPAITS
jgi:hypothetical protein